MQHLQIGAYLANDCSDIDVYNVQLTFVLRIYLATTVLAASVRSGVRFIPHLNHNPDHLLVRRRALSGHTSSSLSSPCAGLKIKYSRHGLSSRTTILEGAMLECMRGRT